ncbi:phosphatase PAP2 family protein [Cupriavidus necator]
MSWKAILYDWGGVNQALFLRINEATPKNLMPLAELFSNILGNYWTAPVIIVGFWGWSRMTADARCSVAIRHQLSRFVVAFGIAFALVAISKLLLDFPRPAAVFGHLEHTFGSTELHFSLPSGHSTYAALVAGVLWPLVGVRQRLMLIIYVVLVGWSRLVAGLHFPADVLAGWVIAIGSLSLFGGLGRCYLVRQSRGVGKQDGLA